MQSLKEKGRQPECEQCTFKYISEENDRALAMHDLACPWGELDYEGITMAFRYYGIRRGAEQKYYLKKIVKIHRMIKEHYEKKS